MKALKQFPILHRFYAKVIAITGIIELSYNEVLGRIENYTVTGRCMCGDTDCATVYMKNDTENEAEVCEILPYDKAFIILHIKEDGCHELEALEAINYPYVQEFVDVFDKGMASSCSDEYAQEIVDSFFKELAKEELQTIVVDCN